ncbi:anthocyanidin 3-O-glucosyltransferase 5-like [Telopea speciosissima]|uniref:anthocyanidin 3-O-glucosyltransferase 5-like n=1 Tax=Telopea speciosissima TaxID=54955 RepID=UPI001CC6B981|nr:anthocyanidin 3-O-glucosyltransferase 5-like [Telopea speciosissima]
MDLPNPHIALFASPGMGHLIPLVALSKRLFSLHGFHSTIFIVSTSPPSSKAIQSKLDSLQLPSAINVVHLSPPDVSAFVTPQTAIVPQMGSTLPRADAILINTWEDFEPRTLKALRENPILRRIMPLPVYPVGPLVRSSGLPCDQSSRVDCLDWLDEQPVESVIYVSFGSGGTLSEEQLTELALGLEMSGSRFLWVVRDEGVGMSKYLPDGFLTRTREVGLVVPMWAPQVEVLRHPSVGGFISHCGWNSTLESMMNGVPMITWPLYAEQRMNAAMLAEDVGVGLRTKELPTKKVVGMEEIEKLVRFVMGKEGEGMRKRIKEVKESGLRAVGEGGSSRDWLSHVAQEWKKIGYNKANAMKRSWEGDKDETEFSPAISQSHAIKRKAQQAAMELPNPHIALFASPGMGHLIPLVALSERLLSLHGFHSTIFVASTSAPSSKAIQSKLDSLQLPSAINVIHLSPPDISALVTAQTAAVPRIHITVRESISALRAAITAMSPQPIVLVVETFGTAAFSIAEELGIPKYVYIPSTAAYSALMVCVPTLHNEIKGEYVDMQEPVRIPGCKPIRVEDLVESMMDRKIEQYDCCLYMGSTLPLADALLINTWEDLEPTTLKALREDPILSRIIPLPVYPVGPLVISSGLPCDQSSRVDCLDWLDKQPVESVIYVSFGSGGTLSEEQLTELAMGLEMSGSRFLWVVRPPAGKDGAFFNVGRSGGDEGVGMSKYLPDGFLTRTREVGLVVPMWAPQVEVLSHPSIGGFLSHCGWSSTLESIVNGVPMIAWPLYAEQRMNAAMLEEEVGVGVRTKELPTKRVVGREEIEKLVRFVMEKEGEGEAVLRRKMKELKESGLRAVGEGGSSRDWLSHVAQQWKIGYAKAKAGERGESFTIFWSLILPLSCV